MATIFAIAALALLISFTCSLFEAALYAITPSEVEVLRSKRAFGAERMARLRTDVDEPIAAILTINTVANTLGSAWCAGLVAEYYGGSANGTAQTAVAVFAGIYTFAVLAASEIIPKSLGVRYASVLAPWIAWPLQWMIWIAWPVARASRVLMRLIMGERSAQVPTTDEILIMSRMARRAGALRAQELRWVENALQLDCVTARDLMTPRTVVESLSSDMHVADLANRRDLLVHTRLPLTEGDDPDKVIGLVHGKDVFRAFLEGRHEQPLRELARPIEFVPETIKGHKLLDRFITGRMHLLGVVDEYGGFEGIVTLEDVLECLLGSEIVDEFDRYADLQQVARRLAEIRTQARAR